MSANQFLAMNILLPVLPCHFGTRLGRLGGVRCFFEGKVLSNRDPGSEPEQDGHVTRRPRHKENGETHTQEQRFRYTWIATRELSVSGWSARRSIRHPGYMLSHSDLEPIDPSVTLAWAEDSSTIPAMCSTSNHEV